MKFPKNITDIIFLERQEYDTKVNLFWNDGGDSHHATLYPPLSFTTSIRFLVPDYKRMLVAPVLWSAMKGEFGVLVSNPSTIRDIETIMGIDALFRHPTTGSCYFSLCGDSMALLRIVTEGSDHLVIHDPDDAMEIIQSASA